MRGFQTHMAEATHPHELSFHQEAFQNRARAVSRCSTADMVAVDRWKGFWKICGPTGGLDSSFSRDRPVGFSDRGASCEVDRLLDRPGSSTF
jgi:hypothetical protein